MIEILGEPRQPLDGRRQAVLREPCLVRDSGIPGLVPASGSQAGYRVPEISPRHSPDPMFICDDFIYRQRVDHKSACPASSEALNTLEQRTRSKSTSGLTQKATRPSGRPDSDWSKSKKHVLDIICFPQSPSARPREPPTSCGFISLYDSCDLYDSYGS